MAIYVGSARISENGGVNGKAGDQKQTTVNDYKGEVAMEKFYVHSLGWNILRPRSTDHAEKIAENMIAACNNKAIGYSQADRLGIVKYGIKTTKNTNCDCSSLIRQVVKESTEIDSGNFTTATEKAKLMETGLFNDMGKFISQTKTPVYDGDILVSCKKGHTVAVVSGSPRPSEKSYYPKWLGNSVSVVVALREVGETDCTLAHRKKIAVANGFVKTEEEWIGTSEQNGKMRAMLKSGLLIKA